MSCYHRYYPHGCGWPPAPEWYDPYAYGYPPRRYAAETVVLRDDDDALEEEWSRRPRGAGRGRRRAAQRAAGEEVTADSLQARAEALRDELERIEADLRRLTEVPTTESDR